MENPYNEQIQKVLQTILGTELTLDDYQHTLLSEEKDRELLKQSIVALRESAEKYRDLYYNYGIGVGGIVEEVQFALNNLLTMLIPNSKVRSIIEWWVYEREARPNMPPLKAWDEDGNIMELNEIDDLFVVLDKLNENSEYNFKMEILEQRNE